MKDRSQAVAKKSIIETDRKGRRMLSPHPRLSHSPNPSFLEVSESEGKGHFSPFVWSLSFSLPSLECSHDRGIEGMGFFPSSQSRPESYVSGFARVGTGREKKAGEND